MESRRKFLQASLPSLTASSLLIGAANSSYASSAISSSSGQNRSLSVLDFGAKGDGITDDTQAFNMAWSARKGAIFIPSGYKFLIRGIVGSTNAENDTKWIGEGSGGVLLLAETGGFEVAGPSWGFENVHFFSIGCVPFAVKTGVLSGNRYSYLRKCSFRSRKDGDFFKKCCEFNNVWYSDISLNYINQSGQGDFSKTSVYGIGFEFNYCVNDVISSNQIGSCRVGIHVTGVASPIGGNGCEGLLINNNVVLANISNVIIDNGYYINLSGNVIDIPLCESGSNENSGNPLIFRCMQGVVANNWISVVDSNIIIGKGGGHYNGSGNIFSGNIVRGVSGRSGPLLIAEAELDLFVCTGNQFTFGRCAIVARSGKSSRWKLSNNIFSAQSETIYDVGGVDAAEVVDNLIYSKLNKPLKIVADTAYVRPKTFSKTVAQEVPSISSGASSTLSVPVPQGVFVEAPEYAMAQISDFGMEHFIRYEKMESTATTLRFSVTAGKVGIQEARVSVSIFASDASSAF